MSSPVAHSLIGLAIGLIRFLPRYRCGNDLVVQFRALWRPLLGCVLLANAPDVDYLFGLSAGNLNAYHQMVTHTLIWIGGVALVIWAGDWFKERQVSWRLLGLLLALLGSHLLVDWLTVDRSPPVGMMLAWPFSDHFYHAAFAFFPSVAKQNWAAVCSTQNLRLALMETILVLPIVIITLWCKHVRPQPGI